MFSDSIHVYSSLVEVSERVGQTRVRVQQLGEQVQGESMCTDVWTYILTFVHHCGVLPFRGSAIHSLHVWITVGLHKSIYFSLHPSFAAAEL